MDKLEIRLAKEEDLNILSRIEKLNGNFWPYRFLRKDFLENAHSIYLILEDEGEAIGYATFMKIIDEVHINNIQILEEYRNRGLGQRLVETILTYYKGQDVKGATLEVREDNIAALKLYQKMGFIEIGRRPGYYQNKKTAILMYRSLEE